MATITGGPIVLRDGTVWCGEVIFTASPQGDVDIVGDETRLSKAVSVWTTAAGEFSAEGIRAGNYYVSVGGDTVTITVPETTNTLVFDDLVTDESTWVYPVPATGAYDDPNGNITPSATDTAALYYKDQASPAVVWAWSVANQNWFQII